MAYGKDMEAFDGLQEGHKNTGWPTGRTWKHLMAYMKDMETLDGRQEGHGNT